MKRSILLSALAFIGLLHLAAQTPANVYFTSEISPASLLRIYHALGVEATGRVAIKISTGESSRTYYLRPEFLKGLVDETGGTIVECNTAYQGNRSNTESHRRTIAERGFTEIAPVDIMDEEGSLDIPVQDSTHIQFDRVGSHIADYDFLINLAHFKGHAMGGFGGVLKNQSIGMASPEGKTLIHTAGDYSNPGQVFNNRRGQDAFLESMAAAAQAVHNYFGGRVIYINVMNNLSVDCDCDGSPSAPQMKDIGILASLDPVALDKARPRSPCSATGLWLATTAARSSGASTASMARTSWIMQSKSGLAPLLITSSTLTRIRESVRRLPPIRVGSATTCLRPTAVK